MSIEIQDIKQELGEKVQVVDEAMLSRERDDLTDSLSKVEQELSGILNALEQHLGRLLKLGSTSIEMADRLKDSVEGVLDDESLSVNQNRETFLESLKVEYVKVVHQVINMRQRRTAIQNVIDYFSTFSFQDSQDLPDPILILEDENKKNQVRDSDVNASPEMKQWNDKFAQDEDVVVEGGIKISLNCEILQGPMEDPVKSVVCGHVFSRKGIDLIYQKNHNEKKKCSMPGCSKKSQYSHWIPDPEYMKAVERKRNNQKFRSQLSQSTMQVEEIA